MLWRPVESLHFKAFSRLQRHTVEQFERFGGEPKLSRVYQKFSYRYVRKPLTDIFEDNSLITPFLSPPSRRIFPLRFNLHDTSFVHTCRLHHAPVHADNIDVDTLLAPSDLDSHK